MDDTSLCRCVFVMMVLCIFVWVYKSILDAHFQKEKYNVGIMKLAKPNKLRCCFWLPSLSSPLTFLPSNLATKLVFKRSYRSYTIGPLAQVDLILWEGGEQRAVRFSAGAQIHFSGRIECSSQKPTHPWTDGQYWLETWSCRLMLYKPPI